MEADRVKIEKKALRLLSVSLGILVLLLVISGCIINVFKDQIQKTLNYRIEAVYNNNGNEYLTFSDLQLLKSRFPEGSVSGASETASYASSISGQKFAKVKIVRTDENVIRFLPFMEIVQGTFVASDMCEMGSRVAVISDILVQQLFLNEEVIGNEIILGGIKYKIVGVYRDVENPMTFMASDGLSRVYVPYISFSADEAALSKEAVDILYADGINIIGVNNSGTGRFRERVQSVLMNNKLGEGYTVNEFLESDRIPAQYPGFLVYLLGILAVVQIVISLVRQIRRLLVYLRNKGKSQYAGDVLKTSIPYLLLNFIMIISGLALILVLYSLTEVSVDIPVRYIPPENVFDLSFYIERLREDIIRANSIAASAGSMFENLLGKSASISFVLTLTAVIFSAYFIYSMRMLKFLKIRYGRLMKYSVLAILGGTGLGMLVSSAVGLPIAVPIKYLAVIIILVLAYLQALLYRDRGIDTYTGYNSKGDDFIEKF